MKSTILQVFHTKLRRAELGISLYREYGVISFCEEKDNLLMWSHYTDEHIGMVVEFDSGHEFFNSKYFSDQNSAVGKLGRVMYRKSRLNCVGNHLMEPYFHKSDEWGYEKEHRLLLYLYKADTYLIPKDNVELYKSQKIISDDSIIEFNNSLVEVKDYCRPSVIINDSKFMAMFQVPPESIRSVSFGIRATDEFKESVKARLAREELGHIEMYSAQIDPYDYRIRFTKEI